MNILICEDPECGHVAKTWTLVSYVAYGPTVRCRLYPRCVCCQPPKYLGKVDYQYLTREEAEIWLVMGS